MPSFANQAPVGVSRQIAAPLGIHAKSAAGEGKRRYSRPERIDHALRGTVYDPAVPDTWRMQRKAQGLLADKRDNAGHAAFVFRVAMCHRGTSGDLSIRRSPNRERASFEGVQTCGSVWHCPICAPKIAAERRAEMQRGIYAWVNPEGAHRGSVYLVTYTYSHTAEGAGKGALGAQLGELGKVVSKFKASRAYKALMDACGVPGAIRALETTYGELNGWHCHLHELVFARKGALVGAHARKLRALWVRYLVKHGLAGLRDGMVGAERRAQLRELLRHACTVQGGDYAAEYVGKFGREPVEGHWGASHELTAGHLKRAQRSAHATPWQLLRDAAAGDVRSGELWREYAHAFQGRRQLFWSRGLKELLGVQQWGVFDAARGRWLREDAGAPVAWVAEAERASVYGRHQAQQLAAKHEACEARELDLTDEQLARRPDETCTEHVIDLAPDQWRLILSHEARFAVLRAAAQEGRAGVESLLAALRSSPPTHSGHYEEKYRWH